MRRSIDGLVGAALLLGACGDAGAVTDESESSEASGSAGTTVDTPTTGVETTSTDTGDGTGETGEPPEEPVTVVWEDPELLLKRGDEVLLRFPADGFQLGAVAALDDDSSYDPFYVQPDRWLAVESAEVLQGEATVDLRLHFAEGALARLTVDEQAPGRFAASLVPEAGGPPVAYMRLHPVVDAEEGFYGLGEYFDAAEHRGRVRAMQIEYDPDSESQYNEAHVPVPFVIGTRGWGMFVEDPHPATFDVAAAAGDRVAATFGTGAATVDGLEFHLYAANRPIDVVHHYYATTGAPLLPAPWALGPWIWRDENKDQAQVESDIAEIRGLDLATSAIWIDRPYASAVGAFDWNPTQFTDAPAMISAAHDAGLRVALWSVPYIEAATATAALRSEAEVEGYFPPEVGFLTSDWGEPIDLTNPDAFAWWQELVRTYTDAGIEGFKLDYAEDITVGIAGARTPWTFADGSSERTMHKLYTLLYHRVYAETLPASGGFLLGRAGTYGDQKNVSVIWPGDLDATMDHHGDEAEKDGDSFVAVGGLPAAVTASLSLGPSGFPFFASDTGGYRHSPPDRETFTRWFEYTALTPVMQVGTSSSDVPWEFTPENGFDEVMLGWYREYARLHMRLFPYVWSHAQRLAVDGRPLQRPLGLAYPELGEHPSDTYLLGDSLLVAPVVERGATERTLLVPPGGWIDWWTGELLAPGETTVAAPLETLPLFLKSGGIVPLLRPTIDTLAPTTTPEMIDSFAADPGRLYARVAPAEQASSFAVYDGTELSQQLFDDVLLLAITPGDTFKEGAWFEVIATPNIVAVLDGDEPMTKVESAAALEQEGSGWTYSASVGGTLLVKIGEGAHSLVARRI